MHMPFLLLLLVAMTASAGGPITSGTTAPPTPCLPGDQYIWLSASDTKRLFFICDASGWQQQGNIGDVTSKDLTTTSAGKGAEMVNFKGSSEGSVDRTVAAVLRDAFSLSNAGCPADGVNDAAACLNLALKNASMDGYAEAKLPNGVYAQTRQLKVPNSMAVHGEGRGYSSAVSATLYAVAGFPKPSIVSVTAGVSTTFECAEPCGLQTGEWVSFDGFVDTSWRSLNKNLWAVSVIDATHFAVGVNSSMFGSLSSSPAVVVPQVVIGDTPQTGTTAFASILEGVTIDSNSIAGACLANKYGQEHSSFRHSSCQRFTRWGILWSSSNTQNSGLDDIEVYKGPSTPLVSGMKGVVINGVNSFRGINGLTVSSSPDTIDACVEFSGGNGTGSFTNAHFEGCTDGLQLGNTQNSIRGFNGSNITGGPRVINVVKIDTSFGDAAAITLNHVYAGGAMNTLVDGMFSDSCLDSFLEHYHLMFGTPGNVGRQWSCSGGGSTWRTAYEYSSSSQNGTLTLKNRTSGGAIALNLADGNGGISRLVAGPTSISLVDRLNSSALLIDQVSHNVTAYGNVVCAVDGGCALGVSGARINTINAAGFITSANTITGTSVAISNANNPLAWANRSKIFSPSDGKVSFRNSANSGDADIVAGVSYTDRAVVAKTANYTLTDMDRGVTFTNSGATAAITITNYTTTPNRWNRFCVDAAQNVVVSVPSGTTIQAPGTVSAPGGNVSSNQVGACVELHAISPTKVQAFFFGNWTVN